ncbi:MAG: RPA family protein [Halolamina sp.]
MSADDGGPGGREVAHRLFAAEFDDASLSYSEGDEERAPNYVVTPGGARVNRAFAVGVLTEVESVNEETLRGRVVDPTGPFVTYAGQYQPDEMAFLERATAPAFVALTGKARTFEPDDGDRVYTSLRPESFSEVDADVRDRWVVSAAEQTLERVAVFDAALADDRRGDELRAALSAAGAPESLAAGIPKAIDHYGTDRAYLAALREVAVGALEVVAGEREEAPQLDTDPGDPTPVELGSLPAVDVDLSEVEAEGTPSAGEAEGEGETESEPVPETATPTEVETEPETTTTTEEPAEPTATTDKTTDATAESAPSADESSGESTAVGSGDDVGSETDSSEPAAEPESESVAEADSPAETEPEPEPEPEPTADSEPASTTTTGGAGGDLGDFGGDASDAADGLGDFDGPSADADAVAAETGDAGDDGDTEDGGYELSDEEREEAMEHGVEFSTGTEVDDPGAADIDTPDQPPEDLDDLQADANGEDGAAETAESGEETETTEPADADLEAAVVEAMESLDDNGGADREAVVDHVAEETGADPDVVDDAIQDALMAGKCFEPEAGKIQAI